MQVLSLPRLTHAVHLPVFGFRMAQHPSLVAKRKDTVVRFPRDARLSFGRIAARTEAPHPHSAAHLHGKLAPSNLKMPCAALRSISRVAVAVHCAHACGLALPLKLE